VASPVCKMSADAGRTLFPQRIRVVSRSNVTFCDRPSLPGRSRVHLLQSERACPLSEWLTTEDLVETYSQLAPVLLPHLKDRLLTLMYSRKFSG
jgi:hypothetical protein